MTPRLERRGLLIATTNRDKLREIHTVLDRTAFDLLTLTDLPGVDEPEESGATFQIEGRRQSIGE